MQWKFDFTATEDILSGTYSSEKNNAFYNPDLVGTVPDAAYKYDSNIHVIIGESRDLLRVL